MKKIIILSLFLVISLFQNNLSAQEDEYTDYAPVDLSQVAETEEARVIEEEQDPAEEKKEKPVKVKKSKEKTDPKLGVVYLPVRNTNLKSGKVYLQLKSSSGSYNIYAIDEARTKTALLASYENSSSSFFGLKVGGTAYRLNKDAGVKKEVRQLTGSCQLAYTIPGKVQVVIDFAPIASVAGSVDDMVKLSFYISNLTAKKQTIGFKAVFDTILGEGTDNHFITVAGTKINGEKKFESMKSERAIISSNGKTSVQFIFDGDGVTSPEYVVLGSRETVTKNWNPVITENRSFNTVLAYNNSAISASWPEFVLEPEATEAMAMYVAVGTDKGIPNGLTFIDSLSIEKLEDDKDVEIEAGNKKELAIKKPDVDFIVPVITDRQLDPVYIQNLINRINALQNSGEEINRNEVRKLSVELDAILEKIRQRRDE